EGAAEITGLTVTRESWSYNLETANLPAQPIALSPTGTASGVVRTHTWPLLSNPLAGIYYGRFSFAYTEGGTPKTAHVDVVMILQDPEGDPEDLPTQSELFDHVYNSYHISAGAGPNGLGWGLEVEGGTYT